MDLNLGKHAELRRFITKGGQIALGALRQDLMGKFLTDNVGFDNGISTKELTEDYCGDTCLENRLFVENQLQIIRGILIDRGIILRNAHYKWHVVADTAEAKKFLINRTLRWVRAYGRLETTSDVAIKTYALPASDSVVQALKGTKSLVEEVKQAATAPTLPPGRTSS